MAGLTSRQKRPDKFELRVCPGCDELKLIRKGCECCSHSCDSSRHPKGDARYNWKGDEIDYRGAHKRVQRARGKASDRVCRCGKRWALDWANLTGVLSDIWDYEAMCRKCHRRYDKERRAA